MRLSSGTRVGPYEILAPLGEGGMGEVYRARDARLARDVALKVLPARVAEAPRALARFEKEAQAVAALSHPNILAIFDYGHADGVAYSVTELLEGESLRETLRAGALPTRKVAEYGAQVALGLAAAHDKGIVHRDLKPENVFLTRDGRVKVLDFGLARVSEAGPFGSDTESPTQEYQTEPGAVVGTVIYMSPEQVRGKIADARSDIFSLGSVLHELATGSRAFQRDTPAETMSAILKEDPLDSVASATRPGRLDPGLERIVRHCLEKNPAERFQSARDLAFDLEALAGSRVDTSSEAPRWRSSGAVRLSPALKRRGLSVLAALGLVASGAVLGRLGREPARAPARAPGFARLTLEMGDIAQPSVSPEGRSFVFVGEEGGDSDLFSQRVGGTNAVNLTADSPDNESTPVFSPDGSQIAFESSRGGGGIFVMGATGEATRRLTDGGATPAWSPDGREIAYSTQGINPTWPYLRSGFGELWAVDIASGARRQLTRGAPQDAVQPSWSPGGGRIAYWGLRGGGGQRDIWTVATAGAAAAPVEVTNDPALDWNPVWSPDGRYLYFASDRAGTMGLWRVAIDEATGATRGTPEAVSVPSAYVCGMSFTRDGEKLLLASLSQADSIERFAFDPARIAAASEPQAVFASALWLWASLGVASDGASVAFSSTGRQEDLYVLHRDGRGLRQLTNDAFRDRAPVFAPDGETVLFYSNRSGQYEAWSVRLDGSRPTQLTRTVGQEVTTPTVSPDGTQLALRGRGGEGGLLVARIGAAGGPAAPQPLPRPPGETRFDYASWSLDGKKLGGLLLHASGRRTVGVHALGSTQYSDLGVEAEIPVAWVNGDRDLVFLFHGRLRTVEVASRRARDLPLVSASAGTGASQWIAAFGFSGDRKTLYVLRSRVSGEIWQIAPP